MVLLGAGILWSVLMVSRSEYLHNLVTTEKISFASHPENPSRLQQSVSLHWKDGGIFLLWTYSRDLNEGGLKLPYLKRKVIILDFCRKNIIELCSDSQNFVKISKLFSLELSSKSIKIMDWFSRLKYFALILIDLKDCQESVRRKLQ